MCHALRLEALSKEFCTLLDSLDSINSEEHLFLFTLTQKLVDKLTTFEDSVQISRVALRHDKKDSKFGSWKKYVLLFQYLSKYKMEFFGFCNVGPKGIAAYVADEKRCTISRCKLQDDTYHFRLDYFSEHDIVLTTNPEQVKEIEPILGKDQSAATERVLNISVNDMGAPSTQQAARADPPPPRREPTTIPEKSKMDHKRLNAFKKRCSNEESIHQATAPARAPAFQHPVPPPSPPPAAPISTSGALLLPTYPDGRWMQGCQERYFVCGEFMWVPTGNNDQFICTEAHLWLVESLFQIDDPYAVPAPQQDYFQEHGFQDTLELEDRAAGRSEAKAASPQETSHEADPCPLDGALDTLLNMGCDHQVKLIFQSSCPDASTAHTDGLLTPSRPSSPSELAPPSRPASPLRPATPPVQPATPPAPPSPPTPINPANQEQPRTPTPCNSPTSSLWSSDGSPPRPTSFTPPKPRRPTPEAQTPAAKRLCFRNMQPDSD